VERARRDHQPELRLGDRESAQGAQFSILGLPRDGTLAEKIAVPVTQLATKRRTSRGRSRGAAAGGAHGVSRRISRANLQPGERVLISGSAGRGVVRDAVCRGARAECG